MILSFTFSYFLPGPPEIVTDVFSEVDTDNPQPRWSAEYSVLLFSPLLVDPDFENTVNFHLGMYANILSTWTPRTYLFHRESSTYDVNDITNGLDETKRFLYLNP